MAGKSVSLARRTECGHYVSLDGSTSGGGGDGGSSLSEPPGPGVVTYHVRVPDGAPSLHPSMKAEFEARLNADTLFTGGAATPTWAHVMPVKTGYGGSPAGRTSRSVCNMPGCNGKLAAGGGDGGCVCGFRVCTECFEEAAGVCPACGEAYVAGMAVDGDDAGADGESAAGETWDDKSWVSENKSEYGIGTAMWPDDDGVGGNGNTRRRPELKSKPWRPLSRKMAVSPAILSPYRLLVFIRLVALGLFLVWRVTHVNHQAVWLWAMSVVGEVWFAFSWLLDQIPKLQPVDRVADLAVLKEKFETGGRSDLPGLDVFVTTADPEKEPVLITANTILSILAADYPVEKLACYLSDDGGALLTFEAMAEAAKFAALWVPFCRKHGVEPRNPESYFNLRRDPYKDKMRADFVRDRRRVRREYDEFKVRINGLPDAVRGRSDTFNAREEAEAGRRRREAAAGGGDPSQFGKPPKATWMVDATHWPGTWISPTKDHTRGDHAGIIQVLLNPPSHEPQLGRPAGEACPLDFRMVDMRLPMLVYMSREKRPGYDHNKKAGAMNALVRASAVLSNGAFMLNLDCDHYVHNSQALRAGICFVLDSGGDRIAFVQFPQRFEGIDPSDRYANHNRVFFDVNMHALDGIQGPIYVGTGCLFRRLAIYGFDPPRFSLRKSLFGCCFPKRRPIQNLPEPSVEEILPLRVFEDQYELSHMPKKFGNSQAFIDSIPVAEYQGRPLADHPSIKVGRPPGALTVPRPALHVAAITEAVSVVSCWYEEKTEWGHNVGWIYGSVTEDVVTGYRMHTRGWRSAYCVTQPDAFRGTAPINLTDRLYQVLRWATGSVEIFFSRSNALLAGPRLKLLQRIAYLNVSIYPFGSVFLVVYCFIPAMSLFSQQFIVQTLSAQFLVYLLVITTALAAIAFFEIKWSGITLEEWWRNEQFWMIGGTSAYLVAVLQGILKVIGGIDISFTLTAKQGADDEDDEFADLYIVKWTSLMILPLTIIMVNIIAIAIGMSRAIYSEKRPEWGKVLGGVFFSFWVLAHLYPFAKGLMGRRGRIPTVVFIWAGLTSITLALICVAISPPAGNTQFTSSFSFP